MFVRFYCFSSPDSRCRRWSFVCFVSLFADARRSRCLFFFLSTFSKISRGGRYSICWAFSLFPFMSSGITAVRSSFWRPGTALVVVGFLSSFRLRFPSIVYYQDSFSFLIFASAVVPVTCCSPSPSPAPSLLRSGIMVVYGNSIFPVAVSASPPFVLNTLVLAPPFFVRYVRERNCCFLASGVGGGSGLSNSPPFWDGLNNHIFDPFFKFVERVVVWGIPPPPPRREGMCFEYPLVI